MKVLASAGAFNVIPSKPGSFLNAAVAAGNVIYPCVT